jgi:hypothetical protein
MLEYAQYPNFWKNVIDVNIQKLVKKDLVVGDYFFNEIHQRMRETLPNAKIVKIKILMNYYLWQSFKLGNDQL